LMVELGVAAARPSGPGRGRQGPWATR
jgi:hypothetical protein